VWLAARERVLAPVETMGHGLALLGRLLRLVEDEALTAPRLREVTDGDAAPGPAAVAAIAEPGRAGSTAAGARAPTSSSPNWGDVPVAERMRPGREALAGAIRTDDRARVECPGRRSRR